MRNEGWWNGRLRVERGGWVDCEWEIVGFVVWALICMVSLGRYMYGLYHHGRHQYIQK